MHTRCLCHGDGPLPPTLFAKDFTKRLNFYQFLSPPFSLPILSFSVRPCIYIYISSSRLFVHYRSFSPIKCALQFRHNRSKTKPAARATRRKKTPVIRKYENNRVNVSNVKLAIIEVYYFLTDDRVIRKSAEMFLTITRKRSNQ